jgi:thioredoxin-like negative regulator of GroEL
MRELNEQQAMALEQFEHVSCALFLYTPLCGTCAAASKMLDILEAMDDQLALYACNINLAPQLAQEWKIESVPCIAVIHHGRIVEKIYAIRSVPSLYECFTRHGLMKKREQDAN